MHKVLVPLPYLTEWSLAAVFFALEFAKRNPVKVILLLWPPAVQTATAASEAAQWQKRLADLLAQGHSGKIPLELQQVQGEVIPTVARLAKELGGTEIIIALPPPADRRYQKVKQMLQALQEQVEGQIITVKQKEGGKVSDLTAKEP